MTFVPWDDSLALEVDQFDEHHKHLIGLVNDTYEKFLQRDSDSELEKVFDALIDYTVYHFSAEEDWMEQQQYPDLDVHKVEHAYFTRRIKEMHKDLVAGDVALDLELLNFMKNWILNHIAKTDSEYGRFVNR